MGIDIGNSDTVVYGGTEAVSAKIPEEIDTIVQLEQHIAPPARQAEPTFRRDADRGEEPIVESMPDRITFGQAHVPPAEAAGLRMAVGE